VHSIELKKDDRAIFQFDLSSCT